MMKVFAATATLALASTVSAGLLSCLDSASDGKIFQSLAGGEYKIMCGVDYNGGDLSSLSTDTFEDCIAACDKTTGCIDVSYLSGSCYLKNAVGSTPSTNGGVWTAKSTKIVTKAKSASSTDLTCDNNASDGVIYKAPTGEEFKVYCGTDFWGGDLNSQSTDSFSDCVDLCSTTDNCVDVSFVSPTCYMKSTLTSAVSDSWVWSAKLKSIAVPGEADTSNSAAQDSSSSAAPVASSSAAPVVSSSAAPVVSSSAVPVVSSSVAPVVSSSSAAASSTTAKVAVVSSSAAPVVSSSAAPVVSSSAAPVVSSSSVAASSTTTKAPVSSTTSAAVVVSSSTSSKASTTLSTLISITTSKAASTTSVASSTAVVSTTAVASSTVVASKTSSVPASSVSSAPRSVFTIQSAFYGDKDITASVIKKWVFPTSMIVNTFAIESQFGIVDPWAGQIKDITILYIQSGKQRVFTVPQNTGIYLLNSVICIGSDAVPAIAAPTGSAIKIVSVVWGSDQITSATVYKSLYASYAANSKVTFCDSTFGTSSWWSWLTSSVASDVGVIYYTQNGILKTFVGRENTVSKWY